MWRQLHDISKKLVGALHYNKNGSMNNRMDNEDAMNLNDADYMSGDELIDQNSDNGDDDEATAVEDTLMNTAVKTTSKEEINADTLNAGREKYPNGSNDVRCKFCKHNYCLNMRRSGTSSLLRHMKISSLNLVPGTPGTGRKIYQLLFREMIAYKRIRDALHYENPSIEFWCRNTTTSDCLNIYENETLKLRQKLK
ncbi:hypothetical protein N665_3544s0002 [Sinapis alba]|nr:hypothetical protein N665_3544s0002 [Sinapis alba]